MNKGYCQGCKYDFLNLKGSCPNLKDAELTTMYEVVPKLRGYSIWRLPSCYSSNSIFPPLRNENGDIIFKPVDRYGTYEWECPDCATVNFSKLSCVSYCNNCGEVFDLYYGKEKWQGVIDKSGWNFFSGTRK